MVNTLAVGVRGERLAETYLAKKGYEVVERNFRTKLGEVDLIVRDGEILVFVEVKTKSSKAWGSPEEMFGRRKYNQVKRMGILYLNGRETKCRIDMIAVDLGEGKEEIRHYENVDLG